MDVSYVIGIRKVSKYMVIDVAKFKHHQDSRSQGWNVGKSLCLLKKNNTRKYYHTACILLMEGEVRSQKAQKSVQEKVQLIGICTQLV